MKPNLIKLFTAIILFPIISNANLGVFATMNLKEIQNTEISRDKNYSSHIIKMNHPLTGHFNLYKKKSLNVNGPQPVLFLLTGASSVRPLVDMGIEIPGATVIALDYDLFNDGKPDTERLAEQLPKIQSMIVLSLLSISNNPEYNRNKISVLSVSLGTYMAPYALRAAETLGFRPAATIFAYGGASITPYIDQYKMIPNDEQFKSQIYDLVKLFEPSQHLKYLTGPFLVIGSTNDNVIPSESGLALETLLPEPKMIIKLDTPHIGLAKPDVIKQTLEQIFIYLNQLNAI